MAGGNRVWLGLSVSIAVAWDFGRRHRVRDGSMVMEGFRL